MLACYCNVWTNGIYWEREKDKVIVEVTENYHCVTIVTSIDNVMKSSLFFNIAIKRILKLGAMHSFKCQEYLIAPSNVAKARSLPVSEGMLYSIKDNTQSVSAKCDICDNNDTNNVDIEQIVGGNYPILCITPSVTKGLFNAEMPLQEDYF